MEDSADQERRRLIVPPNSAKKLSLPLDLPTPPVCSVHPGRFLQLTTVIGVSKMKNSFINMETYSDSASDSNSFILQRSKLKSGRLQPLGLHTEPFLTSTTCLGVIPVDHHKRLHRSLTAPAVRPDSRTQSQFVDWKNASKSIQNFRRAYSANPNMMIEINSRKSTESNHSQDRSVSSHTHDAILRAQDVLLLPPVASHTSISKHQSDIRIEIKGKKKDVSKNTVPSEMEKKLEDSNLDQSKTFIHEQQLTDISSNNEQIKHRRRRINGGNTAKGKLSHGWTPPQPLAPLKGSFPPVTDSKRLRILRPKEIITPSEAGISSVRVDINEILSNEDT